MGARRGGRHFAAVRCGVGKKASRQGRGGRAHHAQEPPAPLSLALVRVTARLYSDVVRHETDGLRPQRAEIPHITLPGLVDPGLHRLKHGAHQGEQVKPVPVRIFEVFRVEGAQLNLMNIRCEG